MFRYQAWQRCINLVEQIGKLKVTAAMRDRSFKPLPPLV